MYSKSKKRGRIKHDSQYEAPTPTSDIEAGPETGSGSQKRPGVKASPRNSTNGRSRRPSQRQNLIRDSQSYFGGIRVNGAISRALSEMGYSSPTPIQESVIPAVHQGKDVVGQAQTGTGKTASFGIPIIESLDQESEGIQALILVPTRELAVQVRGELVKIAKYRSLKSVAIYGGQAISRQLDALRRGAHIVIATPGRLMDHMERRTIRLDKVKYLVLDEADQMLDIGFADDIRTILRHLPRSRQTLLFSATMPRLIRNIAARYMNDPDWILVGEEASPVDQVEQVYFEVAERDRYKALEELLTGTDMISQALVFRRTKKGVDRLVDYLKRRNYDVQAIHGEITQAQRDAVMARFRAKKLRILIATNVAARGLDIPAVSHVINYDIPDNVEDYIHRIGRTARMGMPGTAITFVSEWDFDMLEVIRSHVGDDLKTRRLAIYGG